MTSPENSPERIPLTQAAIHLHPLDNVAIAKTGLEPGTRLEFHQGDLPYVQVSQFIPPGHKIAITSMAYDESIIRYGQVIGRASQYIAVGQHVHTHNVQPSQDEREYVFCEDAHPVDIIPEPEQRRFLGFQRRDGRVGTRNFIAVIGSVQCATQVCHRIAGYFTSERLIAYQNVDGVIALTVEGGCGGQSDYTILQRTLAGMACHPNVAAATMVGLGCEGNQLAEFVNDPDLIPLDILNQPPSLVIQELGGARKTIEAGIEWVQKMLPRANAVQRTPQPLSKLTLALECGGSDSWSGITANPLVGMVSDEIVRNGGTVVLAETPEVYGAEHLLTRRAISVDVGQQLLAKLAWWSDYLDRIDASFENNPAPGNLVGGLTNICEKSLGAIAKSGTTPLRAVYDYAERIQESGFVHMDTTGYDPVSVTGMMAGGCNLVLFTTGRGSVSGYKPVPSLKICTNSTTYRRMVEDMDFNAGRLLDEDIPKEDLATELLDLVVSAASGEMTKSEYLGLGELEFSPWTPMGPV